MSWERLENKKLIILVENCGLYWFWCVLAMVQNWSKIGSKLPHWESIVLEFCQRYNSLYEVSQSDVWKYVSLQFGRGGDLVHYNHNGGYFVKVRSFKCWILFCYKKVFSMCMHLFGGSQKMFRRPQLCIIELYFPMYRKSCVAMFVDNVLKHVSTGGRRYSHLCGGIALNTSITNWNAIGILLFWWVLTISSECLMPKSKNKLQLYKSPTVNVLIGTQSIMRPRR